MAFFSWDGCMTDCQEATQWDGNGLLMNAALASLTFVMISLVSGFNGGGGGGGVEGWTFGWTPYRDWMPRLSSSLSFSG